VVKDGSDQALAIGQVAQCSGIERSGWLLWRLGWLL
jgi:hypothetical protein